MGWSRFFHRADRDAEIAREIRSYLDTAIDENLVRGMAPGEARAAAYRKLGNSALIREEIYGMNTIATLDNMFRDAVYALRAMRKYPAFTAAVVLTLALGIGANTAIFTVIRAVLLKPLEYRSPERLVHLVLAVPKRNVENQTFSLIRLEEMRTAARSFSGIGAFGQAENFTLSGGGEPEVVNGARVSANFLDVLGVSPAMGRGFVAADDDERAPATAMISGDLWRRRFHGSPGVFSRPLLLDDVHYTIVGVLPDGFAFPKPDVDVWVPKPSQWTAGDPNALRLPLLPADRITWR